MREVFYPQAAASPRSMSEGRALCGPYEIQWFNGGLFNGRALELSARPSLANLYRASRMDWWR